MSCIMTVIILIYILELSFLIIILPKNKVEKWAT